MSDEINTCDLTPSPSRLVESLRDTGYSYQAAFADIVDNSIAAEAKTVHVQLNESLMGDEVYVCFYDDGIGMSERELLNAMRYGSDKRSSPKSLGKFGMGLKTASTAFCRQLTVLSKKDGQHSILCWDLDHIAEQNKWELLPVEMTDFGSEREFLDDHCPGETGTAVIWRKVDRLVALEGSEDAKSSIDRITDEIRQHLSATFGKFLRRDIGDGGISITINGEEVLGWDPTGMFLNTDENPKLVASNHKKLTVNVLRNSVPQEETFELNGYVLPNKSDMSDTQLSEVRFSNDNQGFYIYREDRLIYGGGWPHRMYSQDSHLNLLRVELNFDHRLDDFFEIDIRKSKINFPPSLRKILMKHIAPWRNEAVRRYRNPNPPPSIDPPPKVIHTASSDAIRRHENESTTAQIINYDSEKNVITVENRFGTVSLDRAAMVEGTDVFVSCVQRGETDPLWDIAINSDKKIAVVLNEGHSFYKRFYNSSDISPILIQAMDSLLWSFASAEIGTVSDKAKRNYEELRTGISISLRNLAKELPDVEG